MLKSFKSKSVRNSLLALAGIFIVGASTVHAQLLLQLQAANYDPSTGIWTDTSGNGNNAVQTAFIKQPELITGVTPNGSSAVSFTQGTFLTLLTGISDGNANGYTAFVFLQPSTATPNGVTNGNGGTIFAGLGAGSFQFRISGLQQDIVRSQQADLGKGNATLPIGSSSDLNSSNFSSINTTTGPAGGTYRLNGVADGTSGGSTYTTPISNIGTNDGGANSEYFNGDIAEIRIYSGILDIAARQAVEAQFTASYITPLTVPEPGSYVMLLGSAGLLAMLRRRSARAV